MGQNQVFLRSEGDAWYKRNKAVIEQVQNGGASEDMPFICESLSPFQTDIGRVLEIGCSSGMKLERMCANLQASGCGLDPSSEAIAAGNARQKNVDMQLHVGSGDSLPFQDQSFDLVYFGFCLYLFERSSLLRALAEADRVLRPGGFLAITDFDPGIRQKRVYAHCENTYSFKQDYAHFFVESGMYYLVAKNSFSHRQPFFDKEPAERVATTILYKELDSYPLL